MKAINSWGGPAKENPGADTLAAGIESYRRGDFDSAVQSLERAASDELVRERATTAREFDPAEMKHGHRSSAPAPVMSAILPHAPASISR